MKYLHFLNGLAYDSMPPAPCQEKIYDLRKRAGGGTQGGFGRGPRRDAGRFRTRGAAGRMAGRGGQDGARRAASPAAPQHGRGAAAMLRAGGGRPSAVRESFRPI